MIGDTATLQAKKIARTERLLKVAKLRDDGFTFEQIGNQIGVSTERARQLFRAQDYLRNKAPSEWDGLSTRVLTCLRNIPANPTHSGWGIRSDEPSLACGDKPNRDAIRVAIQSGRLTPGKVRNYGVTSHQELLEWMGMASINDRTPDKEKERLKLRLKKQIRYAEEKIHHWKRLLGDLE